MVPQQRQRVLKEEGILYQTDPETNTNGEEWDYLLQNIPLPKTLDA